MKKFVGYFCVGAKNQKDAILGKGLLVWSESKPSKLVRFFNKVLLKIYWVDSLREMEDKGYTSQSANSQVQMRKLRNDGRPQERSNTTKSSTQTQRN